MPDIIITTGQDLAKLQGTQNARAVFKAGVITVPDNFALRDCKGLILDGTTAPTGRVCLTGWPLQVFNAQDFTAKNIAFHLIRPTTAGLYPNLYEKWWSSPRFISTSPNATRNVRLSRCEFRGNTDEIAFWADYSPAPASGKINGQDLVIEDCIFGPSLMGLTPGRERHNFGLMLDGMSNVQIRRCLFVGHNRRNIQQRGERCLIEHCHFLSYGTMAIGIHGGSSVDIVDCRFQPTAMTPTNRPSPIKAVEGTIAAFGSLPIRVRIENCSEIGSPKHLNPQANWNLWNWADLDPTGKPYEDTMQHWGGLPQWRTPGAMVLNNLGVQDNVTKSILTALTQGQFAWIKDSPAIPTMNY